MNDSIQIVCSDKIASLLDYIIDRRNQSYDLWQDEMITKALEQNIKEE